MTRSLLPEDELFAPATAAVKWQVVDPRPRCGKVKLFNCETFREDYISFEDINAEIVAGRLTVKRPGLPLFTAAAQNDPALDRRLEAAQRALRDIDQLSRKLGVSFASAYRLTVEALPKEERSTWPSRATLYRYEVARRQGLPVLRGDKNKGNRRPRYSEKIVQLICDTANSLFLKEGSPWTLRDLTVRVNDLAHAFQWLDAKGHISRPFIAKTIFNNLSVDPEIERMHPSLVRAAKSIARKRIKVMLPMERVEQDALHLPFVVSTPYGPSSNVWLIHAIDCATGKVVGWSLMIGSPTVSESLRCVENILFPKRKRLEELGLDANLDAYGTPSLLVFDNGPEARAERMHRLVRLYIDVMHCRAREANGKPFIEHLNRALKEALQTLGGCTRMNDRDGQRDPIELGDELMTLEELEKWVVHWYHRDWGRRELKRHLRTDFAEPVKCGSTPNERWKRMTGELAFAIPMSPSLTEWRMTLFDHERRTLSRKTGITYKRFNYRGDNLDYLLSKFGETEVMVLADPDDYRKVFVVDGEGAPLVELHEEFADATTPAMTIKEAQQALRAPLSDRDTDPVRRQFRMDVHEKSIATVGRHPRKSKSRAEQNREITQKVRADIAEQRAIKTPLGPAPRPGRAAVDREVPHASSSIYDEADALPVLDRQTGKAQP